ncbi:MAG: anti-sigma factor [Timaviella obliquedivisa GSE-PSE-MK23-08B]|jgi:anti-sigma-K factor RskA|nr:anti-sigma factor [Timaviella obliquedivisa GSE-PSE-MK23-08B]
MTYSPLPENWQELMAGYALGDLSSEEAELLQRLLSENPDLTSEVDHFQEVLALMPYALPEPEPPPHLRTTILSQAQADKKPVGIFREERSLPSSQKPRKNVLWKNVGGAIAALLLVTLAVDNYRLHQQMQQNQTMIGQLQQAAKNDAALTAALKQPNAQLYALEGTQQTSGSLVVVPAKNQITIVNDLPQLPQGQVYRLWAIAASATKPTYCGEFNAGAIVSWSAPEAVCSKDVAQMLITAELASDPLIPKGELVMKSRG